MLSNRYIILLLVSSFIVISFSCRTVKAPPGAVPKRPGLETDSYGGWMIINPNDGELIAIDENTIYLLPNDGKILKIDKSEVIYARLIFYNTHSSEFGAWTAIGSIFTISHGLFALFSLPMWLISGIVITSSEAHRVNYLDYPNTRWDIINRYSRFPQGIPPDLDFDLIKLKSNE